MPDSENATPAVLRSVGATFDHVAHAVPSIRVALRLYRDILGGQPSAGGINPHARHLAIQLTFPGGKLELIEPTSRESESVGAFLRRSPRGGLHHVTFRVSDLEETFEVVTAAGYSPVGVNLAPSVWREIFLHPTQTGGILIQLVEAGPGIPPPLSGPVEDLLDEADALRAAEA